MVDLVFALDQGLFGEELAEYAADAPHVDFGAVFLRAQQEFRASVPEGDDELGELRWWIAVVSCHAEVGDFDLAPVVHQDVGCLQITVQDPVAVEVLYGGG